MIPVNIISGFLGAGKTTAILQLFGQKKTEELWAVVVNEFGKISIDSQTLRSSSPTGDVFDISGGCICCTAKVYLNETLEEIAKAGVFSRIIIEPSGLGGIEIVSEIVQSKPNLKLKPVICLVDINSIRISRLMQNPVFRMQISKSDVVVFTKTDLVPDKDEIAGLVDNFAAIFPQTHIHNRFSVDISMLDLMNVSQNERKNSSNSFSLLDPALSAANYLQKTSTFSADIILDIDRLSQILAEHPSILRAKGYIRTQTGWKLFNYTLSSYSVEDCNYCTQNELVFIVDQTEISLIDELEYRLRTSPL